MLRNSLIAVGLLSLVGCSNQQVQQLGLGNSPVTGYAQSMSNSEICDIYLKKRTTNQTRSAIAAEWRKRKLSRVYCDKKANEWYATRLAKWLTLQGNNK